MREMPPTGILVYSMQERIIHNFDRTSQIRQDSPKLEADLRVSGGQPVINRVLNTI